MADTTYYCKTCGRTMDASQFYTSTRLDKYPNNGKLLECKKCITRHVNNWDPKTYLWILEEINVPYIKEEWDTLLERYSTKNPEKLTGMTILGRYLSKMKLNQYSGYTWADNDRIKAEMEEKKRLALSNSGFNEEEIQSALEVDYTPAKPETITQAEETAEVINPFEPIGYEDTLTEEDKTYLSIKWGKVYKPYEWVQLEKYYQEMMQSFDIQTPSHEDYLKLICKTSLKAHQLIDLGDIEGFQKMSKVYDALMKSAKFTAVQNKAESGEYINSISELVLLCEKEGGFIPRYYIEKPNDKVDETLADLRGYTNTLVTEEMNLGTLIESALKALQRQAEKQEDKDIDDEDIDDEDLFSINILDELNDEDHEEHFNFLEQESKDDTLTLEEILEDEEEE